MTNKNDVERVAPALLDWWEGDGRKDLPWQQNPTPYRIWVSEIMLQQTQVGTVIGYYDRFMETFPDVQALARAELDSVLHLWSGLGYYARARNMHRAAGEIIERFNGELPSDFDALESLPGIGRSTAGAILALSADQRHPILDGNARRVLARLFGVAGWPGNTKVNRELWRLADACTPAHRVANYTQAIMDLGASVCTRRKAKCTVCPFNQFCIANQRDTVDQIPAPRPKRDRPQREVVLVMVVREDGAVLLEKRPSSGIWGGLWGFPETIEVDEVPAWCLAQVGIAPGQTKVRSLVRHGFTHFDLAITPVEVHIATPPVRVMEGDRWLWYNLNQPPAVGLAAPVTRLLATIAERQNLETEHDTHGAVRIARC
jgi:A/G-specific adenine glycosylase